MPEHGGKGRLRLAPLLRDTAFRRYWTGRTLSQVGGQVRALALPLTAVLALHAGAGAMGLLGAAGSLPYLLFSLPAGAWVERRGRRRQTMLACDLGRAALLLAVALLWRLGLLQMASLYALAFLLGTLGVVFAVSSNTLFVALVARERYVEANTLLAEGQAAAFLVGPGLGGVLVQVLSAPLALATDAFAFLASALSLWRIRPQEPAGVPARPGHLAQGLRTVWASPVLRPVWLGATTLSLFRSVFFALYVLYLTRSLAVTPAELGIILGPSSLGAVASAALAGALGRRFGLGRVLALGTALSTLPLFLVPLAAGSHLVVISLLFLAEGLVSAGVMVREIAGQSVQAAAVGDAVRSRVSAVFTFTGSGLAPVGALLGGALARTAGVRPTLWLAAVGAALAVVWLVASPALWRLRDLGSLAPDTPLA